MGAPKRGNGDDVLKEDGHDGTIHVNETPCEGRKLKMPILEKLTEVMKDEEMDEEALINVKRMEVL